MWRFCAIVKTPSPPSPKQLSRFVLSLANTIFVVWALHCGMDKRKESWYLNEANRQVDVCSLSCNCMTYIGMNNAIAIPASLILQVDWSQDHLCLHNFVSFYSNKQFINSAYKDTNFYTRVPVQLLKALSPPPFNQLKTIQIKAHRPNNNVSQKM